MKKMALSPSCYSRCATLRIAMGFMLLIAVISDSTVAQFIRPVTVSHAATFPQFQQQYLSQEQQKQSYLQQQQRKKQPDDLQQIENQLGQLYAQNLLLTRGCPTRPAGCRLNCAAGFAWGLGADDAGATCLCICQSSGCANKICASEEICVDAANSSSTCVSLEVFQHHFLIELRRQRLTEMAHGLPADLVTSESSCPRLLGGTCRQRCRFDADCRAHIDVSLAQLRPFLRCCGNGCGRECVLAAVLPSTPVSVATAPVSPYIAGGLASMTAIQSRGYVTPPPLPITPQVNNQIASPQSLSGTIKPGVCPPSPMLRQREDCLSECTSDALCRGAEKCCETKCGRICSSPEKTSHCVHLLSAVERLHSRSLANGHVPSCSPRGHFNPVQCDTEFCWCVIVETGNEIYGTKRLRHERAQLNCKDLFGCGQALEHCARNERKCPFGFRTDENGCPLRDCICRDLCDGVLCENAADECQLVEPDCARPPCTPVPKCLLNPCPVGAPMTLANGVTALCKQSTQCWDGFWCHQVGYNGLGFCCPQPQSRSQSGICAARAPIMSMARNLRDKSHSNCTSECRSDEDCPTPGKCCFDGCGLKCVFNFKKEDEINQANHDTTTEADEKTVNDVTDTKLTTDAIQASNKELLAAYPKLAKCPAKSRLRSILQQRRAVVSRTAETNLCDECRVDADCPGLQLCCAVAVHSANNNTQDHECHVCVYSQSTTKCLHDAITYDFYSRRGSVERVLAMPPRCIAPFGDYAEEQCNTKFCSCVDKLTGVEIAGTRALLTDTQAAFHKCELRLELLSACPLRRCENAVPCVTGEFVRDERGCATCDCVNTCVNLQCQSDEICVLAKVDCVGSSCARQPRCVINPCPRDARPFSVTARSSLSPSSSNDIALVTEQCADECPAGYQCHRIGLPGEGGVCCPAAVYTAFSGNNHCAPKPILLLPRDNPLCGLECHTDTDCDTRVGRKKCCFNGCGTHCIFSSDGKPPHDLAPIQPEVTASLVGRTFGSPMPIGAVHRVGDDNDDERLGECAIPPNRVYGTGDRCALHQTLFANRRRVDDIATQRLTCARDADCAPLQKCCKEACSGQRQCQFPLRNTACLHLKAAYLQSGAADLAMSLRCTNEGLFASVQCADDHCWCVNELSGVEVEGTRVSTSETLNCREPRKCTGRRCATKQCAHGFEKDEHGCDTCECANPCNRLKCPEKLGLICVPEKVECLPAGNGECPYVPKCVPNVCAGGVDSILIRVGTFQPAACTYSSDCPPDYYCRALGGGYDGVCCLGHEPAGRPGRCPVLKDWTAWRVEPESCELQCSTDADCANRAEKCCYNGCGLSCMAALFVPDLREVQHSQSRLATDSQSSHSFDRLAITAKVGECPRFDAEAARLARLCSLGDSSLKRCINDADCADTQKCCETGCNNINNGGEPSRFCIFPAVTTRCQQARIAALLILKALPNNIFMPSCARSNDFEPIQRHNGAAWCVDTRTGHEIQGSKSSALLLTDCAIQRAKSCPILACSFDCPYGFETDLLGCQLCACKNPCRDVRCAPNHICQMARVKCFDTRDTSCTTYVPRCTLNACPISEPLQDALTRRFFECDERAGRGCPAGWFCHKFGLGDTAYCCTGTPPITAARSRLCPHVAPLLTVDLAPTLVFASRRALDCRTSDDCRGVGKESCCYNGRDTSCVIIREIKSKESQPDDAAIFGPIHDDSNGKTISVLNFCGHNSRIVHFDDKGEARVCSTDHECGGNDAKCKFTTPVRNKTGICCRDTVKSDSLRPTSEENVVGALLPASHSAGVCPSELGVDNATTMPVVLPAGGFSGMHPTLPRLFDQNQICHASNECDTDADCAPLSSGENNDKGGNVKKCCMVGGTTTHCRHRACVQPFRATNCVNTLAAIIQLQRRRILHNLYTPYCDTQNGNYRSNQCDDSEGWCWCVDATSGQPILGTRTLQPTFDVCTLAKRSRCVVTCDERHLRACPFGVEMDKSGCPRSPQCRCRSPCADVRCPRGELCIMRARTCQEDTCLPVPVCEINPCSDGREPARSPNASDGALLSCNTALASSNDSDLILTCPIEHFCTSLDEHGVGICCPGKATNTSLEHGERNKDLTNVYDAVAACKTSTGELPNLASYFRRSSQINDDVDRVRVDWTTRSEHCNIDAQCAKTHFCGGASSKEKANKSGICCPSNQFICAQSMNAGYGSSSGCSHVTSARFYFDYTIDACVQFIYGGCGGNLNNFLSSADCEAFCLSAAPHNASSATAAQLDGRTVYIVGFTMRGPETPAWKREESQVKQFQRTLHDYVRRRLGDAPDDIVSVNRNGTVTLAFSATNDATARRVAQRTIETIAAGDFQLRFENELYSALPESVFSRQSVAASTSDKLWDSRDGSALFWIITMASLIFALVIVIILCSGYNFLCVRSSASARGESVSPTSYSSSAAENRPPSRPHHLLPSVAAMNNRNHRADNYTAAATITSTARRLKVISLPHQPQTHLLTISNYNGNSTQTASDEARVGVSRYAPTQLLLAPATPKTIRVPPAPIVEASSPSTSSTEAEPRFMPHNRTNRRTMK